MYGADCSSIATHDGQKIYFLTKKLDGIIDNNREQKFFSLCEIKEGEIFLSEEGKIFPLSDNDKFVKKKEFSSLEKEEVMGFFNKFHQLLGDLLKICKESESGSDKGEITETLTNKKQKKFKK